MDAVEVVINCALIVALGFGGVKLIKWLRRQLADNTLDVEAASGGFTLAALRDLLKAGKITNDEYERLKVLIIAAAKRAAERIAAEIAERKEKLEGRRKRGDSLRPPYV